jgi:hypothetical protein
MNTLETALYEKLAGGTALTALLAGGTASPAIYNQQAPDGSEFPYVVFTLMGGGDENETPHRTKNLIYQVRGVSKTSPANVGLIDAQIDARLHLQQITVTDWTNFWIGREGDFALTETVDNVNYYHAGGQYRIRLDQD